MIAGTHYPDLNNPLNYSRKLERAKGFEPSTPTLARLCSTPELRPLGGRQYMIPDR
jgi:hypothetical protein